MLQHHILLATYRCVRPVLRQLFVGAALLICMFDYTAATACGQQEDLRKIAQNLGSTAVAQTNSIMAYVFNQCSSDSGLQWTTGERNMATGDRPCRRHCKMPWRKVYRRCQVRYSIRNRLEYLKLVAVVVLFMVPWLAWV